MASAMIPSLLFLSLLPFLHILVADNVTLSSSLTATIGDNSSWISPSQEFAFGFRQLNNTNLFLLAIWYAKIPGKTIVWHAKPTNPMQGGSKVSLMENGIVLNDPNGQTIWKAEVEPNNTVSYGAMLNTGNFVLSSGSDSVYYVWESFNNPTDTILPSQVLGLGGMLFSRLTQNNYSKGRFELHFSNEDVKLYLVSQPTDHYYRFEMFNATNSSESAGYQLVFNESAYINIVKRNGETVPLPLISWRQSTFTPNSNNYYRATLDFDGVFRQYAYPRSSSTDGDQSWSVVRYIPDNICNDLFHQQEGSGACGFNSICKAIDGTPSCECPRGYSLMDPNNQFGGCKPDSPQGCGVAPLDPEDEEELFEFERIPSVNWPSGDYESFVAYNESQCQQACLHDCMCAVAIFGASTCWKKKLPLSNGRSGWLVSFIKLRKSVPPSGFPSTKPVSKTQKQILVGPLVSSLLFNVLLLLVMISRIVLVRRRNRKGTMHDDSSVCETNLRVFSFKELKDATDGFKDELGRGSFGIVYKGVLKFGSRNLVAVKKLDKLSQEGEREFRAEVRAIGKTHHKNLVDLLGYCHEGPHRLLVYEFMSNGSLADFLSRSPRPNWNQRAQMALGIARGLVYLHEECNVPIIHCDIKPQNILLDNHFTARISDFGLAKSLMFDQTRTLTGIRGTRGYVALEWFKSVPVTVKVDVYSFGVMLLEIIFCRKSVEMVYGEDERAILTNWVYDCYMEGKLEALVLENDDVGMCDMATLNRWVMIAIWCIQEDPSKRPTMKMVTQMLEGSVEVLIPPASSNL